MRRALGLTPQAQVTLARTQARLQAEADRCQVARASASAAEDGRARAAGDAAAAREDAARAVAARRSASDAAAAREAALLSERDAARHSAVAAAVAADAAVAAAAAAREETERLQARARGALICTRHPSLARAHGWSLPRRPRWAPGAARTAAPAATCSTCWMQKSRHA
jgi:hypothetical protein